MSHSSYSRADLEQMIRKGGSVLVGGKHVTRVEDLPSEAQLAGKSREHLEQVIRDLQDRKKGIDRQIDEAEQKLAEAERAEKEAAQKAEEDAESREAEKTARHKGRHRGKKAAEENEGEKGEDTPVE